MIDDRIASPHPDYLPATGDMLVAPSGALWVERIDVMEDPGAWEFRRTFPPVNANQGGSRPPATVWDVFDADGNLRGSVSLPDRFKAYSANDNAIVGVLQDEIDVEYSFASKSGTRAAVPRRRVPHGRATDGIARQPQHPNQLTDWVYVTRPSAATAAGMKRVARERRRTPLR